MPVDPVEVERALRFVRPRLRGHAGDMTVDIDAGGTATVQFFGACESCPAMAVTYAGLVQSSLEAVAGINAVRAPQVHASPAVLAGIRRRLGVRSDVPPGAVPLGMPGSPVVPADAPEQRLERP
ncbi:MAG TPA: NifU family protein [Naasia sp.]|jgi:Fe-S cluster biogenesis protein NfuA